MNEKQVQIESLEKLFDATTQGTWVVHHGDGQDACQIRLAERTTEGRSCRRTFGYACDSRFICDLNDGEYHQYTNNDEQEANAVFIATAHNAFRFLLDEVKHLYTITDETDMATE